MRIIALSNSLAATYYQATMECFNQQITNENMYKKLLSLILVSFLIQMVCISPVSAVVITDTETQRIAEMKEHISRIYLENKRVTITRRDGTKLKGHISEVKESSFIIRDEQTDATNEINYDEAIQVKSKSNGLSTRTKILLGVGIAAAVVVVVLIVKPLGKSPFPKCNADRSNAPCDNSR